MKILNECKRKDRPFMLNLCHIERMMIGINKIIITTIQLKVYGVALKMYKEEIVMS